MKKIILRLFLIILLGVSGCTSNNAILKKEIIDNKTTEPYKRVVISTYQPQFSNIYKKYSEMFENKYNSQNKEKIKIEIEIIPQDEYTAMIEKKLTNGSQVDLFTIHASNNLPEFVEKGYIEDLSDTKLQNEIIDGILENVVINSKFYGVPLESMAWGYLYNKDVFEKLGLRPADTLYEMNKNIKQLETNGYTPFLISYKDSWIPQLVFPLVSGAVNNKTGFLDAMYRGSASFGEIEENLFNVLDIVNNNGNKDGMEIGGVNGCKEFASGKYGMWIQGPWFAETILGNNKKINFGIAPLPIDNNIENTKLMQTVSTMFVVAKNSKNTEICIEFLKYILSNEISNKLYQELKFNPVAKNQDFPVYPWTNEALGYVNSGRSYKESEISSSVKDESGILFQKYYLGKITRENVIMELNKKWREVNF